MFDQLVSTATFLQYLHLHCKDDIIEDIIEESLLSEVEETDVTLLSFFPGGYYNRVSTNSLTLISGKLSIN